MPSSSRRRHQTVNDTRNTRRCVTNNAIGNSGRTSTERTPPTSAFVTPSPTSNHARVNSIRDGARQRTYARQSRSTPSAYDLHYRRIQPTNTNPVTDINVAAIRICYCDQPVCPSMCPNRRNVGTNVSGDEYYCLDHPTVFCHFPGCARKFHVECVRSYLRDNTFSSFQPYYCCLHQHQLTWNRISNGSAPDAMEIGKRLGIDNSAGTISRRSMAAKIQEVENTLLQCRVPENILNQLKNNPALPYPSIVKMDTNASQVHADIGRRFEVSLLMYKVDTCSCCGITQPYHSDPFYPKESPLPKAHFNKKYYDAWECNCLGPCHGQQFFGVKRTLMISAFKALHNNIPPDVFICGIAGAPPNAKLCQHCYWEYNKPTLGDDISIDMRHLPPAFSTRNGFGGKVLLPPIDLISDAMVIDNINKAKELSALLLSFTAAEEAAIRQITPLLSIVRLKEGNIGAKGNTHLVWQQSKLSLILPNLPSECKFIIIRRPTNGNNDSDSSKLKSTKFERRKIARALELLLCTVENIWKTSDTFSINVSEERLAAWPENGDLADMNPHLHVCDSVEDDDGRVGNMSQANQGRVADGNDIGPAPLQNSEEPDEIFEGVMNYGTGSNFNSAASIPAVMTESINEQRLEPFASGLLPAPYMSHDNHTATYDQDDVIRLDGFANMSKTPFAWARAFPTVFIPEYLPFANSSQSNDDPPFLWKWVIRHDPTAWYKPRDKEFKIDSWYQYMMWRHDGVPAAHPTFSLALFNYKSMQSLQRQGQFVINTSDMDPNTTIDEILHSEDNTTIKAGVEKLINRAHCHSANIPGTPRYWRNTYFEFEAITQFHSHILKKEPSFFITNSLADHHEYPLRLLLYNYTKKIMHDPNSITEDRDTDHDMVDNDIAFSKHSQTYKNVVTHYFASKIELWYTLVLKPVLGLDLVTLVHEFQTGRGAIHSHVFAYSSEQQWSKDIKAALHAYAIHITNALRDLDTFIESFATNEQLQSLTLNKPQNGMKRRETFLKSFPAGVQRLREFYDSVEKAKLTLEETIARILEVNFGFGAMHHGELPAQWVKPGGLPGHGYRSEIEGMASSKDVLETKELKHMKFQREDDLLNRRVNITNHCGVHKCSDYCIKYMFVNEPYHPDKHKDIERDKIFVGANGVEMVRVKVRRCRMHFGNPLSTDFSGENNITGGIPFAAEPSIEFDKNQLPKYVGRRNHPRIITEPDISLLFGANNDIQPLLINSSYSEMMESLSDNQEHYDEYFARLLTLEQGGLEHFNASHIIHQYLTSYQCKGGKSTEEWKDKINLITENFCADVSNGNKTLRSLIGKHMHEIPKSVSVTRDQSQYMLGGGILKRTTYGSIRKCSVTASYWDDLVNTSDDTNSDNNKRFVWNRIYNLYKNRSSDLSHVSVYHFCCCHWPFDKKEKPVQFFGFNNSPSWPLDENYSRWILTLYYPWQQSPEELQQPTFAAFLGKHYTSEHIPSSIRAAISRTRYNLKEVEVDSNPLDRQGNSATFTPTEDRMDERLLESARVNEIHNAFDLEGELQGLFESHYEGLPLPDPSYDWTMKYLDESSSYNKSRATKWLLDERDIFYQERCAAMMHSDTDECLELFDEHIFRPENARGRKQKLIVFMLLYQHYKFHKFQEEFQNWSQRPGTGPHLPPPSIFLLVEGKPGSGKSFILKTLRNITRIIMKSNRAELTSAPTGVAGSLINASTHCRVASIPTGKEVNKPPYKISSTNYQQVMSLSISHLHIFTRLMDEHSMMGRRQFAWMKHRMEELRRPFPLVDNKGEDVFKDHQHPLDKALYERPFGGIPFIMSCGDFAQLPAVMDKMLFDNSPANPNTADCCGKVGFAEFINSSNTTDAISSVVIMDEVIRQDDLEFKSFLENVANGTMSMEDIALIRSRCLQALPVDERVQFKNAIHLVPTWSEASEIVFDYLSTIGKPIAKWKAKYSTTRKCGKNCCLKEKSYPSNAAACVGAPVMLLKNFIVEEWKILNGSIGTVVDVIYDNPLGPREPESMPSYIVVDFKNCSVPEDRKCFDDCPSTYIAIPVITERCEKGCCTISTIPLRICIAITVYKGQGITVGDGEAFERIVVHLPMKSQITVAGQELVQFSRAKDLKYLAIGNSMDELVTEKLLKIGKNKGNEKRKEFLEYLRPREEATFAYYEEEIQKLVSLDNDSGTFDDGCDFLLRWYREHFF